MSRFRTQLFTVLFLMGLILSQPGCQIFGRFRNRPILDTPIAFSETPTKDQLLAHIGQQTEKVQQLQSDVRISVAGMPTLRGTLAVEKPNRLRMNAGPLGVAELGIDVGSNDDVFWFWTKVAAPGQEPGIYYAKHDEYKTSNLQRAIPIEPGWLIDALGLLRFEPNDRVEGPFQRPNDGRLEIHTYRNVGNQPTIRVSVIDPKFGFVIQQTIYDATGRRMAYVDSIKYEHYPEHNISLPSRIELTADSPDGSQMKLTVDASKFKINSLYGDPKQLWSMPNPGDVKLINLVTGPANNGPEIQSNQRQRQSQNTPPHRTSSTSGLGQSPTSIHNLR